MQLANIEDKRMQADRAFALHVRQSFWSVDSELSSASCERGSHN